MNASPLIALVKAWWKSFVLLIVLGGAFIAGNAWSDREWEKRWAVRDSDESSRQANAQTAARMIEQGRIIARDEAVKDAQEKAAAARDDSIRLSGTVSQLQQQARKLATRLDAAKHTADLAATVRGKTAGTNAAMLADMLGSLAAEAKYYAERSDESYRAGMTCQRIYDSVRESNNQSGASQ